MVSIREVEMEHIAGVPVGGKTEFFEESIASITAKRMLRGRALQQPRAGFPDIKVHQWALHEELREGAGCRTLGRDKKVRDHSVHVDSAKTASGQGQPGSLVGAMSQAGVPRLSLRTGQEEDFPVLWGVSGRRPGTWGG